MTTITLREQAEIFLDRISQLDETPPLDNPCSLILQYVDLKSLRLLQLLTEIEAFSRHGPYARQCVDTSPQYDRATLDNLWTKYSILLLKAQTASYADQSRNVCQTSTAHNKIERRLTSLSLPHSKSALPHAKSSLNQIPPQIAAPQNLLVKGETMQNPKIGFSRGQPPQEEPTFTEFVDVVVNQYRRYAKGNLPLKSMINAPAFYWFKLARKWLETYMRKVYRDPIFALCTFIFAYSLAHFRTTNSTQTILTPDLKITTIPVSLAPLPEVSKVNLEPLISIEPNVPDSVPEQFDQSVDFASSKDTIIIENEFRTIEATPNILSWGSDDQITMERIGDDGDIEYSVLMGEEQANSYEKDSTVTIEYPNPVGQAATDDSAARALGGNLPAPAAGDLPPTRALGDTPPAPETGDIPPARAFDAIPPARALGDTPPGRASSDTPPARAFDDTPPASATGDIPPSRAHGDTPPARAYSDSLPARVTGGSPPARPFGGNPPAPATGDIPPARVIGDSPSARGIGDISPARATSDPLAATAVLHKPPPRATGQGSSARAEEDRQNNQGVVVVLERFDSNVATQRSLKTL